MGVHFFIPATHERSFVSLLNELMLPSLYACLFLEWDWFERGVDERSGEMRTATILAWGQIDWWPENVFSGCCPCSCLTLKLLSQLWLVVRDSVLIPPEKAEMEHSCVSIPHACVSTRSYRSVLGVCACVLCACVCLKKSGGGRREGEMLCANPYSLWRIQGHSFMFCQPSVNQFPIKVVLNSAVIPMSSSRFRFTVPEALKHFPCVLSAVCPTRLARAKPTPSNSLIIPVKVWGGHVRSHNVRLLLPSISLQEI